MATLEPIVAAAGLVVCVALLLRMALPLRQRQRLDAALRRAACTARQHLRRAWPGRTRRHRAVLAAAQADAAIRRARRARRAAQRDGNVIRPDAFERPRKPH